EPSLEVEALRLVRLAGTTGEPSASTTSLALGPSSHAQNDIVLKGLELNRDSPPTLKPNRLGMGSGHRGIEGRVVGAGVKRERYGSADGLPGCRVGHLSRVGKISNVLVGRLGENSGNQMLGSG